MTKPALNRRERAILQAFSEGQTAAMIAKRLGLSKRTIEGNAASIRQKLDARTTAAACVIGLSRGLIDKPRETAA
jgi:DNA-binding NarL/FixJ family response regulator